MIPVSLSDVRLPDWSWHLDSREEAVKLTASLMQHGQLNPLVVREIQDENQLLDHYEIVDGRRRFSVMQQLGWDVVWVTNKGPLSRADAIKLALSLELAAEVDYAKLAHVVTSLEDDDEYLSLPMTTPFTSERLRYFRELTQFDWSQFAGGQAPLFEDDDAPRATKPIPTSTGEPAVAKAKQPRAPKPSTQAAAPATNGDDVDTRRAARAALASALTPLNRAAEVLEAASEQFQTPEVPNSFRSTIDSLLNPSKTSTPTPLNLQIMGDEGPAEDPNWRPEPPPQLDGIDEIELDTETTGLKWWEGDKPIGISYRLPDGRKGYLPWGHTGGNLDEAVVKRWAQTELKGKKITNANIRFDNHMLYQWGVDLEEQGCGLADVQHYAALLDEYRKEFGLDILGRDFLGQHKTGQDLDKTRMASYHASQVAAYACQDVHLVGELKHVMIPLMDAEGLQRVRQLECDVIYPVCEMERNAAYINRQKLHQAVQDSGVMLDNIMREVSDAVGFQVNPDSNADMVRLFEKLGLPEPGRTAPSKRFPNGQASFTDALLEKVANDIVQKVRRSGKLASLRSKFLIPYSQVVSNDNKLRFALHQLRGDEYGTVRGRFSMSGASRGTGQFGANLQQVFRVNSQRMAFGFAHDDASHDLEIFLVRALFEAEPYVRDDGSDAPYLSADAQSIEYRLAAHYAESERLIAAYQADAKQLAEGRLTDKWVDFHRVVGDFIRPYKDLSRNIVKNANFCLVYGGGEPTLTDTLGVTRQEGHLIYSVWHRTFPELGSLPRKTEALARNKGFVKTILGRRARFRNADELMWAHAAVNYVIQGSAADIMKTKLVELHKARKWTGLLMRQTVHDEVDGDARLPETADRVRQILNFQTFNLKVPIVWEVETGPNWAVAH